MSGMSHDCPRMMCTNSYIKYGAGGRIQTDGLRITGAMPLSLGHSGAG